MVSVGAREEMRIDVQHVHVGCGVFEDCHVFWIFDLFFWCWWRCKYFLNLKHGADYWRLRCGRKWRKDNCSRSSLDLLLALSSEVVQLLVEGQGSNCWTSRWIVKPHHEICSIIISGNKDKMFSRRWFQTIYIFNPIEKIVILLWFGLKPPPRQYSCSSWMNANQALCTC